MNQEPEMREDLLQQMKETEIGERKGVGRGEGQTKLGETEEKRKTNRFPRLGDHQEERTKHEAQTMRYIQLIPLLFFF